jgi:hypothetical protein
MEEEMRSNLAGEVVDRRKRGAQSIADGNGGCTEEWLEADTGWVGDYGITDRSDLAGGGYGSKTGRW